MGRVNKNWSWGVGELEALEAWEAEELKAQEAKKTLKAMKALEADAKAYENFTPGLFEMGDSAEEGSDDVSAVVGA